MFRTLINTFWVFWVFVWVATFAITTFASPPLTITEAGYFLTTVDDNGNPQYVKLTTIIDLTGDNQPPGDDVPDIDLEVSNLSKAWADEIEDPIAAQAMAAVYSHVRGAYEDDILHSGNIWPTLAAATDKALPVVEAKPEWSKFRSKLTAYMTERKQKGGLQSDAQIRRLLLSVQHGLELSADKSTAIGLNEMAEIARLVNEVIDATK